LLVFVDMSESVRPSIPRPRTSTPAPASVPPASVVPAPERIPTLDLEEGDILVAAPRVASTPPPPPPVRAVSVSPPAPASVPPPPASMARPITTAAPTTEPPRMTMTDPTDVIFDGMYGLTFARSPGEAAELCAETLATALGARAVVIHSHDLTSRELRAIGAHGDGDFDILGSSEPSDDDLVASAVICNQKPLTMRFEGELPRVAPKRLHAVGAPRTLVAAPVMSWGRCLAIIEVIDADERFATRVADSAAYVADHLAQFLLGRAA
jgi:hypothetical protein